MQVVGRLPRRRVLVERLVVREHQRQMAVEEVAERLETRSAARGRCRPRSGSGTSRAEVLGELADERADQHLRRQPLPPEGRPRPPGDLGDPLERQPVPPALAEDGDRRASEFLVTTVGFAAVSLMQR